VIIIPILVDYRSGRKTWNRFWIDIDIVYDCSSVIYGHKLCILCIYIQANMALTSIKSVLPAHHPTHCQHDTFISLELTGATYMRDVTCLKTAHLLFWEVLIYVGFCPIGVLNEGGCPTSDCSIRMMSVSAVDLSWSLESTSATLCREEYVKIYIRRVATLNLSQLKALGQCCSIKADVMLSDHRRL